jgi:hypothetical protein
MAALALFAAPACSLDLDGLPRRDAMDATAPLDAPSDTGADTGPDDGGPPDARCPAVVDCADRACDGEPCDDGLGCTTNDACAGGTCRGAPVVCSSSPCQLEECREGSGCVGIGPRPDGAPCPSGACCFGSCVDIRSNAHCGGCGLSCEEDSCTAAGPPRCMCNVGCPSDQQCSGGLCHCRTAAQCSTNQYCDVSTGACVFM